MRSSVRPHLPEEELHAWLDGELSARQRAEIAEHLLACLVCRALEAEIRSLRSRTSELLAVAAPAVIHGIQTPVVRRRFRPAAIAAAALLTTSIGWIAFGPGGSRAGPVATSPRLSSVFTAPAIVATALPRHGSDSLAGSPRDNLPVATSLSRARTIAAASSRIRPRLVLTSAAAARGAQVANLYLAPLDPLVDYYLPARDRTRPTSRTTQSIAHLKGLGVDAVRLEPSAEGGRPTALVRQLLGDGTAIWIIEGAESQVEDITSVMAASGLTMALTRRAVPDYVGSDHAIRRSIRVIAVAARLPYDSLENLTDRLLRVE